MERGKSGQGKSRQTSCTHPRQYHNCEGGGIYAAAQRCLQNAICYTAKGHNLRFFRPVAIALSPRRV